MPVTGTNRTLHSTANRSLQKHTTQKDKHSHVHRQNSCSRQLHPLLFRSCKMLEPGALTTVIERRPCPSLLSDHHGTGGVPVLRLTLVLQDSEGPTVLLEHSAALPHDPRVFHGCTGTSTLRRAMETRRSFGVCSVYYTAVFRSTEAIDVTISSRGQKELSGWRCVMLYAWSGATSSCQPAPLGGTISAVCGGWISVETTADVGNQPDAASLQAGLNEAWTMFGSHYRGTCAMPSPPLSATLLHTTITFVCMRRQRNAFEPAPAGLHNIARSATRAGAAHGPPLTTTGQRPASVWGFASLACAGDASTRPYGQEGLLRSPSQPQQAVVFSACLRLGLHKLAFAVASLCVDPAVVRSHAVWVYTDTSALETHEHTSYTVSHIVNRSMWMERHQKRHTAIFVPLGEETGLASCPVGGERSMWPGSSRCFCRESTSCSLTMTRHRPPSSRSRTCSNFA